MSGSCVLLSAVRDVAPHLTAVYDNLCRLRPMFRDLSLAFFYDESEDDTRELLSRLQRRGETEIPVHVLENECEPERERTWRLAHARNRLLDHVRAMRNRPEYFVMVDGDDAASGPMRPGVLRPYLERNDWDALTFHRPGYYDIWALSFWPHIHHCWGFGIRSLYWEGLIRRDVVERLGQLPAEGLLECHSAFNGFAIYRTELFLDGEYDGKTERHFDDEVYAAAAEALPPGFLDDITPIPTGENCEHRGFHIAATRRNGARIRISPHFLFPREIRPRRLLPGPSE
jgi:hypothetical protein